MDAQGDGAVELVGQPTLLPALAEMPGHLLWRAAARVDQAIEELRPDGFDIYSYAALLALADAEPRSQQDVARSIGTSRTTLARVAATLSDTGLVERVRNPADRRSYALTRTPAGIEATRSWRQDAERLESRVVGTMTSPDAEELRRLLERAAARGLAEDTPTAMRASIGFLLHQTHRRWHPDFLDALRPLGLEPRHFGSLVALEQLGAVTQQELARAMGVSGASMVSIVDELEDRGLVTRRRDDADRRAQRLTLCSGTIDVVRRARAVADELHQRQLGDLSSAEVRRLVELLGALVVG